MCKWNSRGSLVSLPAVSSAACQVNTSSGWLTAARDRSYDDVVNADEGSPASLVGRSPLLARFAPRVRCSSSREQLPVAEGEMKRSTRRLVIRRVVSAAMVLGASFLFSSTAFAQEETKSSDADGGYGYEFSDDPLNAGGFGPNDATIRVRPGPVRTTLIRPRTSFVNEMLKSVENL